MRSWFIAPFVIYIMLAPCWYHTLSQLSAADAISFSQDVRPILAEYCLQCHGPDEAQRQADLRLDIAETGNASAILAGKSDESEIIRRIMSADPDLQMPPAELERRPSAAEIRKLRQWIDAGATFEGHWSFQPIRRPELPQTNTAVSTDLDRFIVSALEEKGLRLSPAVDRPQLIRRASFDLHGLPPTPAEVTAFVKDPAPDAFAKVVDRLLESPRYGERWGRHWLDIARYADTHGGSAIGFTRFPFSYTYRDYVIDAFNADLPYDQFVIQQLAADQLGLEQNSPNLAALGFLTVGMQFRSVHDRIDDQIDVVTRGLMGMTVACARCHDHKFDAIPTSDYYAMVATLASSQPPDVLPVLGEPQPSQALHEYERQLEHRQTIYGDMARDQAEVMRSRLRHQVGLYLTELAKGVPEQDVSAAFLSYRTDDVRPIVLNRWRNYLEKRGASDAVFGPWVQLQSAQSEEFSAKCAELVERLIAENGDPAKFASTHSLSMEGPKWNPRVLEALQQAKPSSLIELAQAYGNLFSDVHRSWLKALLETSLEAVPGAEILTDEDPRHAEINSPINQQLRRHLYEPDTPTAMPDALAIQLLNRTVSDTLGAKRGTIHDLHLNSPGSPPRAMVLDESENPPSFHILLRGNPLSRGPVVEPGFLSAISPPESQPFDNGRRRLGLAQAIVANDNPLTRRVIVNWIWRNHFGLGLVRTPDDLGTRGTPPTHPELLDYLASTFLDDGWSIKKTHRRIMLSDVYQQAAIEDQRSREVDAENQLLWRMPRKRLEMEAMRDAMLAVSGELDLSSPGGRPFDFESEPVVPRRSVYGFINRDIISNLSSIFDGADPKACSVKRPDTTVPQQSLFALNSGFIQDRAVALAHLAQQFSAEDEDQIRWMYERVYARQPDQVELDMALTFIKPALESPATLAAESQRDNAAHPQTNSLTQLAHVLLASNEFIFVD